MIIDWKPDRSVYLSFLVDTNCINARQGIPEMNQLEMWSTNGVISLLTAEAAHSEMLAGGNDVRRAKAYGMLFTMSEFSGTDQRSLAEIEKIVFPGGAVTQNQKNDVEILFNSSKYLRPLITNDGGSKTQPGGMLGCREQLAKLGITVLTPAEAVAKVGREIAARDELTRRMSEATGIDVPEWVGGD